MGAIAAIIGCCVACALGVIFKDKIVAFFKSAEAKAIQAAKDEAAKIKDKL